MEWLPDLKKSYCTQVAPNNYNVSRLTLDNAISKLQISKATGEDKITGLRYTKLSGYSDWLTKEVKTMLHQSQPLPNWLSTACTVLLPENTDTYIPKNDRPILCLNIFYKLYTSYINSLLMDHVNRNDIITPEQAAGKKAVWRTAEQLLINENILVKSKVWGVTYTLHGYITNRLSIRFFIAG